MKHKSKIISVTLCLFMVLALFQPGMTVTAAETGSQGIIALADDGIPVAPVAPPALNPGWFGLTLSHPWVSAENISAGKVSAYYTIDGTAPDKTSTQIFIMAFGSFIFASVNVPPTPTVVKVIVYLDGVGKSPTLTYVANLNAPTASAASGVYETAPVITFPAPPADVTYFYETGQGAYNPTLGLADDSSVKTPDETSTPYVPGSNIIITATADTAFIIKARARYNTGESVLWSDVSSVFYRVSSSIPKLTPNNFDQVINEMSLEERVRFTSGVGGDPNGLLNGTNTPAERGFSTAPDRQEYGNDYTGLGGPAGGTYAFPRFGIPSLVLADGPAGVRMWKNATVWMAPAGLGSTWNTDLIANVGTRVAAEAKHYAVDIVLGPGLNTQRNPLAGRNFEYYSEDPYVTGYSASAHIAATQAAGAGVSLKHYAANDSESNRGQGNMIVSERALREIYLRGFEMAATVKPWTYMGAYNKLNGPNATGDKWLMTDVLRGEWGFDGFVMSDWGGDYVPPESLEAQMDMGQSSRDQASVLNWINDPTISASEKARRVGLLNRSVKNIMGILVKTYAYKGIGDEYGELKADGTYSGISQQTISQRSLDWGKPDNQVRIASEAVNKQAADEAIVLLKNKGSILPVKNNAKVAIVSSKLAWNEQFHGRWYNSTASVGDIVIEGTGSAQVRFNGGTPLGYDDGVPDYSLSLAQAFKDRGFDVVDHRVDAKLDWTYDALAKDALDRGAAQPVNFGPIGRINNNDRNAQNPGWTPHDNSTTAENAKAAAEAAAAKAEYGIFVLTRVSGEGADLTPADYELTDVETIAFNAYADAFHAAGKSIIVLLNVGGTVNTQLFREKADAILDVWNPGTSGTEAIADILKGTVNPSGKLAQTFPNRYDDSPSVAMRTEAHKDLPFNSSPNAYYDEGVYVGYRYFESNPEKYDTMVAYPFGYGLSYTNFEFSDLTLDKNVFDAADPNEKITATVKVKNTGTVPGKEVVQLYLGASTWKEEGRPAMELRAYSKTKLLNPGETETVSLSIGLRDLQYFDDNNPANELDTQVEYGKGDGWVVKDDTEFTVVIRNNAENADKPNVKIDGLKDTFSVSKPKNFDLVVDVLEWGSAVTALIIDMESEVDASSVDANKYAVNAETRNPVNNNLVYNGSRTVTKAYVSAVKEKGKPADKGRYIVLELKYGYNATLPEVNGSAAIVYQSRNYWLNMSYTVTQPGSAEGFTYNKTIRPIFDDFKLVNNPVSGFTQQQYRLYTPSESKNSKPLPLILWNHGSGEQYTANAGGNEGSQLFANMGGVGWVKNAPEATYVLVPQRGLSGYSRPGVIAFINDLIAKGEVDPNRIYVSGCSAGGQETDNYLLEYPNVFAAGAPVCPSGGASITAERLATIKHIPLWFIHAQNDTTVNPTNSLTPYERLLSLGSTTVRRTAFPGVFGTEIPTADYNNTYYPDGHWSWVMLLNNEFVADGGIVGSDKGLKIMDWMYSIRKDALTNAATGDGSLSVYYDGRDTNIKPGTLLMIAQYDSTGRFIAAESTEAKGPATLTTAKLAGSASAQAFIWDGDFVPLANALTLKP